MEYKTCKKCNGLVLDSDVCPNCGGSLDSLVVLDGKKKDKYRYRQDINDSNTWYAESGSSKEILNVRDDGSISCSCGKSSCEHVLGLLDSFGDDMLLNYNLKQYNRSVVDSFLGILEDSVLSGLKYEYVGSYGRGDAEIRDLDILVKGFKHAVVDSKFTEVFGDSVGDVSGRSKVDLGVDKSFLRKGVKVDSVAGKFVVDFYFVSSAEYDASKMYLLGDRDYWNSLVDEAKSRGYYLDRYGLWDFTMRSKVVCRSEEGIRNKLGINSKESL